MAEEVTDHTILTNKLLENFKSNLEIDNEKIKKLDFYSNEIFDKVINEYNKFIT